MPKTFFISYNSTDSSWAQWIAWTLSDLGHRPRVHEWEISGGGNVLKWMEEALSSADAVITIVSPSFLVAKYSQAEVQAGIWRSFQSRDGFVKPVVVTEVIDWPVFLGSLKRLSLVGLTGSQSREAIAQFVVDPVAPLVEPPFPGSLETSLRWSPSPEPEGVSNSPPSQVEIERLRSAQQRGEDQNHVSSVITEWLNRSDLPHGADQTLGVLFNEEDGIHRLRVMGDFDGAIRRFDAALCCHIRAFGAASDPVARVKSNKADALLEIGGRSCLDEALLLAREAVAAQEAQFGPNPPEADISRLMSAKILLELGAPSDLDDADRLLGEASRVARTTQTSRDIEGMLARIAKRRGNREGLFRARQIEKDLLSGYDCNDHSLEHATALNNLAITLWAMGDRLEAETHLVAALTLRKQLLDASHPLIADTEITLSALRSGEPSMFEPSE